MKAVWNDVIIAKSFETIIVEGNHYFPIDSVNSQLLQNSQTTTFCPWKGTANYYNICIKGETNPDAAWYYPETKEAAKEIKGRVAFWKGVQVVE